MGNAEIRLVRFGKLGGGTVLREKYKVHILRVQYIFNIKLQSYKRRALTNTKMR